MSFRLHRNQLRQQLQTQMAAADALIAGLQSQAANLTNLFQSMLYTNQNK